MADAQASGACGRKIVWVQVPSPALFFLPKTGVLLKRSSYSIYKTPDLKTASEFRSTMAIISLLKSWIKSAKLANAQTMHFFAITQSAERLSITINSCRCFLFGSLVLSQREIYIYLLAKQIIFYKENIKNL